MITLRQLIEIRYETRRQMDRSALRIMPLVLGSLVVGAALAFLPLSQLPNTPNHRTTQEVLWFCAALFGFVAPWVITVPILWRIVMLPHQVQELNCPGCGQLLLGLTDLTIATGKCPKCLKHIVKIDTPPPRDPGTLLTIAELQRVSRNQSRAGMTIGAWYMIVTLGVVLSCLGVAILLPAEVSKSRDASEPVFLMIAVLVGGPAIAAILYGWRISVRCPACRMLVREISTVIASGNCPHCGSGIVRDAVPLTEYRPLPKLQEVTRAFQRQALRPILCLFVTVPLAIASVFATVFVGGRLMESSLPGRILLVLLFVLATAITLIPTLFLLFRRSYRRYPELLCHHCRHPLTENSAALRCTGNCPHCGQRAIKDA